MTDELHPTQAFTNLLRKLRLERSINRARVAAGALGFLIFSHAFDGPNLFALSNQ
jgi:hypothetical protein